MSDTMKEDLINWKGCERPHRKVMEGRYARLEPLDTFKHGNELYETTSDEDALVKMKYIWEIPETREDFQKWLESAIKADNRIYYAIIDKKTGRVGGRQSFIAIDEANGSIEIGTVFRGPLLEAKPAGTEALYLFAKHVFDELGYRRLVWKCHVDNERSKRAALRFGCTREGVFRNHCVMKGANRDTVWYSILNSEWPKLREALEKWLDYDNFDAESGQQIRRLEDIRAEAELHAKL